VCPNRARNSGTYPNPRQTTAWWPKRREIKQFLEIRRSIGDLPLWVTDGNPWVNFGATRLKVQPTGWQTKIGSIYERAGNIARPLALGRPNHVVRIDVGVSSADPDHALFGAIELFIPQILHARPLNVMLEARRQRSAEPKKAF
jgi:hypothetical protein